MPRIAYVNGRYVRLSDAAVHIEDRGYQFADGVYEVCLVIGGAYWDEAGHIARLNRSLGALSIPKPMSDRALHLVMTAVLRKNRLRDAIVYMQVTRGSAPRNHMFPSRPVDPTLVIVARPFDMAANERQAERGVAVKTTEDIRWGRVDIKTVGLLPNVLAKEAARQAGAAEAWLVRDGKVTEGASSNAWIVSESGELVTHPLGVRILGGITRETVLECARSLQMKIVERPFTVDEALRAREAFITSAANLVTPVVKIDDKAIGGGVPGPAVQRLRAAYLERCAAAGEGRQE